MIHHFNLNIPTGYTSLLFVDRVWYRSLLKCCIPIVFQSGAVEQEMQPPTYLVINWYFILGIYAIAIQCFSCDPV